MGERFLFATKHEKQRAAQEPFRRLLGASVEELYIESDALGTFSGEVARPGSMIDALRGKIALARQATTAPLILASEGSFGFGDSFGLVAQGLEMMMLYDAEASVEIVEQHLSLNTNYATELVTTDEQFDSFLQRIALGAHAVVVYPEGLAEAGQIHKSIFTTGEAHRAFEQSREASPYGTVRVMSDMRAHVNPTRMQEIALCCERMARRLATTCPSCNSGGFGLSSTIPGLPCRACGAATGRAKAEQHTCPFCQASVEHPRADGRQFAEPEECEWCGS